MKKGQFKCCRFDHSIEGTRGECVGNMLKHGKNELILIFLSCKDNQEGRTFATVEKPLKLIDRAALY